jgi:hypothetical protein
MKCYFLTHWISFAKIRPVYQVSLGGGGYMVLDATYIYVHKVNDIS